MSARIAILAKQYRGQYEPDPSAEPEDWDAVVTDPDVSGHAYLGPVMDLPPWTMTYEVLYYDGSREVYFVGPGAAVR